ncbi:MAG: hypothetical protein DWP97_02865 [Calditrichaeota bacterium]|nr:MAG: hypothetical protein DWP97_02865 [Calditrichota bacterium]
MNKTLLTTLCALLLVVAMIGCEREVVETIIVNDTGNDTDCFTCHSGSDLGLAMEAISDQYGYSIHASNDNTDRNRLGASYYASCEKCHTSEGFIAEVTGVPASGEYFSSINCFTCHTPHENGDLSVRVTEAITLADGTAYNKGQSNLCASCHQSRRDVNVYVAADTTGTFTIPGHFGPHYGNQGDMLIGANAYEYATYTYYSSAHKNVTVDGCIDCHMAAGRHASYGGHSWNMISEDKGYELTQGCNIPSCHNSGISDLDLTAQADFDWDGTVEGIQTEVHGLLDSLQIHLEAAGFVDSTGHSISGVVIPSQDSAGALYNFIYVEDDRSFGVHNTDYVVGLLQSSINFLATGDPNGTPARNSDIVASHK